MHETQIGRYEVVRVLGKGAMGVVCEARDPRLARTVAIKTIRADKVTPAQAVAYEARFLTEARSVARLNHPNIVSVFDSGQVGEMAYLVMEFVPGVNLKHCLNQGVKFTYWGAVKVVLDMLAALEHAHCQKILHRDVKPENILMDATGWVKLTDFGIAKILDAEDDNGTQVSGHSIGTPRYMSPEQVRGQPLDERSDLFSTGVLLYELLTARLPFDGNNQFAIATQILNEAPPWPSSLNPSVPAALDAVVARAMAKHPAERFQSAREFADALALAVSAPGSADVAARVAGAQMLVATESAGMLRWLLSRMLTGGSSLAGVAEPTVGDLTPGEVFAPVPSGKAGALVADLSATDPNPTRLDGTRLYQREADSLSDADAAANRPMPAVVPVPDSTATDAPTLTPTHTPSPNLVPTSTLVPHGTASSLTSAPVAEPLMDAATGTGVGTVGVAGTAGVASATSGSGSRKLLLGGALLLVALVGWWLARDTGGPVVVPSVPPASIADPNQTLSEREVLVQPGSSTEPAPSAPVPAEPPKDTPPVVATPATVPAAVKRPVKAAGVEPAGTATAAPAVTNPADTASQPQAPVEAPQPAPVVTAPPKEPCAGMSFFERESCLWNRCSTDTFRSLPVCERFQTRKPAN